MGLGCVSTGDLFTLQEMSRCRPAFKERDNRGWLVLHEAAAQQHTEALYLVLQGTLRLNGKHLQFDTFT